MSRQTSGKSNMAKSVWFIVLVATLLISVVSIARAAGGAQAFGYTWPTSLKGHRVYIWTGTPPGGEVWTAAPVGMCETCNCDNKKIETGWIKGTAWDLGDVLQQYVAYTDLDGTWRQEFHKGNLLENRWYQVKVMYSTSAARWEAWRFNNVIWYAPHSLAWTRGCVVVAGSENNDAQGWMGVWGWHPEHRKWGGSWTLYNYTGSHTAGGGHIQHAYDYVYGAWGP
ncbi:MAG: hypothetical protein SXV54_01010 [Chloroflexota bacterium]|nr:hypothetical protein [Chloroflexota bacterium]